MRHYETIFIIKPTLGEDEAKEVVRKFSAIIEREKGVLVKLQEWGTQRLAYDVKKFDKGNFILMNYCGTPGLTKELEREMKLDDRAMKFQTVKLADKVDPQELIRKENETKKERGGVTEQEPVKEEMAQDLPTEPAEEVENHV